jgi:hypothetical protein
MYDGRSKKSRKTKQNTRNLPIATFLMKWTYLGVFTVVLSPALPQCASIHLLDLRIEIMPSVLIRAGACTCQNNPFITTHAFQHALYHTTSQPTWTFFL